MAYYGFTAESAAFLVYNRVVVNAEIMGREILDRKQAKLVHKELEMKNILEEREKCIQKLEEKTGWEYNNNYFRFYNHFRYSKDKRDITFDVHSARVYYDSKEQEEEESLTSLARIFREENQELLEKLEELDKKRLQILEEAEPLFKNSANLEDEIYHIPEMNGYYYEEVKEKLKEASKNFMMVYSFLGREHLISLLNRISNCSNGTKLAEELIEEVSDLNELYMFLEVMNWASLYTKKAQTTLELLKKNYSEMIRQTYGEDIDSAMGTPLMEDFSIEKSNKLIKKYARSRGTNNE